MNEDTIRVAVRIRPLVNTEIKKGCQTCLDVVPGESQIVIKNADKSFTFNYVFPPEIDQENFYNTAIKEMVAHIFHGYNVTILAYGQTGSGKTHSMGTDYIGDENMGVIPRAVNDIFNTISSKEDWIYKVTVSFMELYQEQLYDLLSDKQRGQSIVDIREDGKGIKIAGVTEKEVTSAAETLQCLTQGSLGRATGATAMNAQSSRSHAIFTLSIHQQQKDDPNTATTAKFHLVDLAGSERSKKTQATGTRFKEGVNINKGLLALGNVISQLGESGSASYIGYRDSKLTRLLQDSLGGNSMTLMIACVSPADYNLNETLSTLRYADRARKIKNKPVINQDPTISENNRLHKLVQQLRLELVAQEVGTTCPLEHQQLEEKIRSLQQKIRDLTETLNTNLIQSVIMHERSEMAEKANEKVQSDLSIILQDCKILLNDLAANPSDCKGHYEKLEAIYIKILDIQKDQKKTSEELMNYEVSHNAKSPTTNGEEHTSTDDINSVDSENLDDLDEKQEEHTLRQAERNNEVQNINRELALKESLVNQLLKNSSQMIDYSRELQEMEQEIKALQSEREELMQALQQVQANNVSSKLAETRRKKVQELEKKIAELSRKCLEQNKVIKMKEKQDQHIKNLGTEIQSLKNTRVKLIRQMRNDSDRFAKWREMREKELCKLKEQDRKRVNEMTRLKMQRDKQEVVFKRRMKEAFVINKRLKDALDLQKKAVQRREKITNNKTEIQNWVKQEIEVLVSTIDAEHSLQQIMNHRAILSSQLDKLKENGNGNGEEIASLSEFIDFRNAQIVDLQQKILESDQENRTSTRLNALQTMLDAKTAIKMLFEMIADNKKSTTRQYEELLEENEQLRRQIEDYRAKRRASRQFELNRTTTIASADPEELIKLKEELEVYKEKCKSLEQTVLNESNGNKTPKPKAKRKTVSVEIDENLYAQSEDSLIEDDDVDKDPDWTKTPLYNRMQKLWNTTRNLSGDLTGVKRSSNSDTRCACKTKCSSRLCSCRKNEVICTSNCGCRSELCQNKDKENVHRALFVTTDEEEMDESAKRRRLVN